MTSTWHHISHVGFRFSRHVEDFHNTKRISTWWRAYRRTYFSAGRYSLPVSSFCSFNKCDIPCTEAFHNIKRISTWWRAYRHTYFSARRYSLPMSSFCSFNKCDIPCAEAFHNIKRISTWWGAYCRKKFLARRYSLPMSSFCSYSSLLTTRSFQRDNRRFLFTSCISLCVSSDRLTDTSTLQSFSRSALPAILDSCFDCYGRGTGSGSTYQSVFGSALAASVAPFWTDCYRYL